MFSLESGGFSFLSPQVLTADHRHRFRHYRSIRHLRSSTRLLQPGELQPGHHLPTTRVLIRLLFACPCRHRAQASEYRHRVQASECRHRAQASRTGVSSPPVRGRHRAQASEYKFRHRRRRRAPAQQASTPWLHPLHRPTSQTNPTTRTLDSTPPGTLLTTRASPHRTFGPTSHRADTKVFLHLHSSTPSFYAFIRLRHLCRR